MLSHARVLGCAPVLALWLSALSACQEVQSSSQDLAAAALVTPKKPQAPAQRAAVRDSLPDFETLRGERLRVDWVVLAAFRSQFGQGPGFSWVNLPMRTQSFQLMLILPDAGKFEEVRSQFSSDQVQKFQASAQQGTVTATFPKFRLTDQVSGLTPAAAGTQHELPGGSAGVDLHFTANRPFLFAVFDKRSDLLLLKGHVLEPGSRA